MAHPIRRVRSSMRARPFAFAVVLAVVFAGAGFVTAITVSQTSIASLFGTINNVGTSLSVTSTTVSFTRVAVAAAGTTSGAAQEMAAGAAGAANTALTKANWQYAAVVEESSVAAVASGTFKVELFVNDVSSGALYMIQATAIAGTVEGVTFKWDLGSDLATGDSAYRLVIMAV